MGSAAKDQSTPKLRYLDLCNAPCIYTGSIHHVGQNRHWPASRLHSHRVALHELIHSVSAIHGEVVAFQNGRLLTVVISRTAQNWLSCCEGHHILLPGLGVGNPTVDRFTTSLVQDKIVPLFAQGLETRSPGFSQLPPNLFQLFQRETKVSISILSEESFQNSKTFEHGLFI